jgi:hypothetical protein
MPVPAGEDLVDRIASLAQALAEHRGDDAKTAIEQLKYERRSQLSKVRLSQPKMAEVFARDHFVCRYCEGRTIPQPVLRALSSLYPEEFPYHPNWKTGFTHPAYVSLTSTIDHIVPVAHGGPPLDLENLATACWPCNAMKGEFTLERIGFTLHPPSTVAWDGLVGVYPALADLAIKKESENSSDKILNSLRLYHNDWKRVFSGTRPETQSQGD